MAEEGGGGGVGEGRGHKMRRAGGPDCWWYRQHMHWICEWGAFWGGRGKGGGIRWGRKCRGEA